MKKVRFMLTAFAVIALVGAALAFKANKFTHAAIFCETSAVCADADLINYVVTASGGSSTNPCPSGKSPYIINGSGSCVQAASGTLFTTTDAGN